MNKDASNTCVNIVPPLLLRTGFDESVHAKANRQLVSVVQLDENFENLVVELFLGLIGLDVLFSEKIADLYNGSGECRGAEGVGFNEGGLAERQMGDIDFIDIGAHAKDRRIGECEHGRLGADAFACS